MCPFYVVAPVDDLQQQQGNKHDKFPESGTNGIDDGLKTEQGEAEALDVPHYGHHLQYGRLIAVKRTWETWHQGGDAIAGDDRPESDQLLPCLFNDSWQNGDNAVLDNSPSFGHDLRHFMDDVIYETLPAFEQSPWHPDSAIFVDHSSKFDQNLWHNADTMPDHSQHAMAADGAKWTNVKNMTDQHPSAASDQRTRTINMHTPVSPQEKPPAIPTQQSETLPRAQSARATGANWPLASTVITHTTIDTAPPTSYQHSHGHQHHQQLPTPPATPSPRGKTTTAAAPAESVTAPTLTDYSWRVTKSGDQRQIDETDNWVVPYSWRQPAVHLRVSSRVRNWTELERWEREAAQRRPERGPRRGKTPPRYGRYAEFVGPRTFPQNQQQDFGQEQQQQQEFAGQGMGQAPLQQHVEAVVGPRIVPQHQTQQQPHHVGVSQEPQHQRQQLGEVQGSQTLPRIATSPRQQQPQLGAIKEGYQLTRVAPQRPAQQQPIGAVQGSQELPRISAQQRVPQTAQQHVGVVQLPQQGQPFGPVQRSQTLPRVTFQKQLQQANAAETAQQLSPQQQQRQHGVTHSNQGLTRTAPQRPADQKVGPVQPTQQQQQHPGITVQTQGGAVPLPKVATALQRQVTTTAQPQKQQQQQQVNGDLQKEQSHNGAVHGSQNFPRQQVGAVQGSQTLPRMAHQKPQQQLGAVLLPRMASPQLRQAQPQQIGAVQPKMAMAQQHIPAQTGAVQGSQLLPRTTAPEQQQQQTNAELREENGTSNWEEWQECSVQMPADFDEDAPNATMETKVSGGGAAPKRVGRWTLAQLRQTDGIIPSQAGWNKGDSQKLMTNFGTPRNTTTKVKVENLAEIPEDILLKSHGEVRLQAGTNRFASQKGFVAFGTGRDVCREGVNVNVLPADLEPLPEEKIRASDGIVRLQAGTNKFDSQKGMTLFGTGRRETTRMKDSKHPEYSHERDIDNTEIPLQMGTNKFASQKGMTGFGTNRRETTKMLDTAHPEYSHEQSIDQTSIPYQMGSNKYASQKGMTGFGQPRWEVLDPSISYQNRKSQGMVRLQSGTNRFASQAGMTGFGTPRNTTYEAEAGELPYEDMKKSEAIIPSQAGWNKGDSQKLMTNFGTPRDVKGKHLKRIWELEYPEEAEVSLDRL